VKARGGRTCGHKESKGKEKRVRKGKAGGEGRRRNGGTGK